MYGVIDRAIDRLRYRVSRYYHHTGNGNELCNFNVVQNSQVSVHRHQYAMAVIFTRNSFNLTINLKHVHVWAFIWLASK